MDNIGTADTIEVTEYPFKAVAPSEPDPRPEHKPRSIAELGICNTILENIALKTLYLSSPFSILDLSEHLRLHYDIAEQLFTRLRGKLLCEVTGLYGTVPVIAITSQGRAHALELLAQNQYAGAAPVPIKSYVKQVREQSVCNVEVHPADVARAFSHLVFDPKILSQFGTALNSGQAIFLYGPPGVGKSSAAEALSRVIARNTVWIPYAVEADGQIITIYDPAIHERAGDGNAGLSDSRWVRCQRPRIMVGGELTADMLDLQFNPTTKYYDGPPQMKANNGVLIIDDFGRQRIPPEELLNRWVVPLDRRIEFLTLVGGTKIKIPFEMLVVFASNRNPATLLDPAFLRRIQTKIKIDELSDEQFIDVFRGAAKAHGLEAPTQTIKELIAVIREKFKEGLRPCQPRDLINQVCWAARYENQKPTLDRSSLMRAAQSYFLPPCS